MYYSSSEENPDKYSLAKVKEACELIGKTKCIDIFHIFSMEKGSYVLLSDVKTYILSLDRYDVHKTRVDSDKNIRAKTIFTYVTPSEALAEDVDHNRRYARVSVFAKPGDKLSFTIYRMIKLLDGTKFYIKNNDLNGNILNMMPKQELIQTRLVELDRILSSESSGIVNEKILEMLHWLLTPEATDIFGKLKELNHVR